MQNSSILSRENQEWLDGFQRDFGRKPTVLHIGNIANNAYNNAKLLNLVGFDCDVVCYDYYHIMGCPEWDDADFDGPIDDDFRPSWFKLDLKGFVRPRWFAQGPMALCLSYLLARRQGGSAEELWEELQQMNGSIRPRFALRVRMVRLKIKQALLSTLLSWNRVWFRQEVRFHRKVLSLFAYLVLRLGHKLKRLRRHAAGYSTATSATRAFLENRKRELVQRFADEFPDRPDQMTLNDLVIYDEVMPWRTLLALYDFVIAYSTDPIYPLLYGKNYFALEHGTLRSIPFDANAQGRRTALSYRLAQHIFVTNFDCAKNAATLAPSRYTLLNHPYDEDHGVGVNGADLRRRLLEELDSEFLIFHPTRQDWVPGTGFADKSNDTLLRAFAELRKRGGRVGLIACMWGSNVGEAKDLIRDLGCAKYVKWISPLAVIPFERMCSACDIVADQFKLGSFGGVVYKAIPVGAPILTYLDMNGAAKQYAKVPPVVNCATTEDIVREVISLTERPDRLQSIRRATRAWTVEYHGKVGTINRQVDQFRISA